MGVRRSDYLIIGYDIGYDQYHPDKYDEFEELNEIKEEGKLTYLIDFMNGEYFFVGEIIKCDEEGINGFGTVCLEEHSYEFIDSRMRVKRYIKEKFGMKNVLPRLYLINHFS
ncbi:hypothetical protein Goe21_01040 [Bacillus phage vB_BsuM-Goe21]|nr:hypothetical protein Goe21_01040 [Bacillus phage vB_BsuM-Goe21]